MGKIGKVPVPVISCLTPPSPSVVAPPGDVGTDTVMCSYQRKIFYANELFWVFYHDGTNIVYKTSADGTTWSSATTVKAVSYAHNFSIWFDGTYLHYAHADNSSISYRRGTPNSDGSITWSANEQTVSTTYNYADFPFVSVDTNGYVWIGYKDYDGADWYPYVIKSGNNDGTWGTTPSGFPHQLSTTSVSSWRVSPIPLTNGKMLVIYSQDYTVVIRVKAWDGSSWGTETATTSGPWEAEYYSAVAQGDDVHITFVKDNGVDMIHTKYTYTTNSFGAETTIFTSGLLGICPPVLSINPATNDLYVFFTSDPTAPMISYRKYTAATSTWETTIDWIGEGGTTVAWIINCFYKAYSLCYYIGFAYMPDTSTLKFAFLKV